MAVLAEGSKGENSRGHFDWTLQNGLTSSSVSGLCIEDNRVSGEYASTTHQESDAETTRVSNSCSFTKIQKVILLSSVDQFRTIPRDGDNDGDRDRILRDKMRQLMVTTPVNAETLPPDSGQDKSMCDKTKQLMVTPPVSTETIPRDKTRGLFVTAPVKLATTAYAVPYVTVQTSSSYASRFVLPRETSTFSTKPLGFVDITSDIAQPTRKILQLNNGVIGRRASFNSYQGRSAGKFTWNRPHLRARPPGRVASAGKRLKYQDEQTLTRVSYWFCRSGGLLGVVHNYRHL